ncbi:MAG: Energy-dependent translational throttle protein EttA [Phycisphaerae bacterium]|nr:Energy-dependent translational throttle protein EttA [Phycisphaerae bacterium]
MGAITLHEATRQFGGQHVLRGVTLELQTGQIAGLVGANGAGKTTLFRLIAGQLPPDTGTVTRSRGLEVGYLPQEPQIALSRRLHDEVAEAFADLRALEARLHELSDQIAARHDDPQAAELMAQYDRARAEFETAGGYTAEHRLHEVLGGLGFTRADYDLPMSALSGGQRCRAALAKLLLAEQRFLLLDEPTNHLDLDACAWLEKFLAGHQGGAVIISHDRYLLDRVAGRIIELDNGVTTSYPTNYTNYVKARDVRLLALQRQAEKDRAFIKKEEEFYARYHYALRSKQAHGRMTRLQRQIDRGELITEGPRSRKSLRLDFAERTTDAATILHVDGLSKAYGDKQLFRELTFQVWAGQRLGITGPNGTGKSTLLKIVLGEVTADAGVTRIDPKVAVGYYSQDAAAQLEPENTLVAEIRAVRTDFLEQDARNYLGRFLFHGEDVFKRVGQLSGGEQSRVRLAKLMLAEPNLLVLDEPTNHLDIPSREALEQALDEFPGTVIVVSHDRYFLDRVVDRLLVIRQSRHALYNGNYSFYTEQLERERAAAQRQAEARRSTARSDSAKRRPKAAVAADPRLAPYARLSLAELEQLITQREHDLAALSARFGDADTYKDAKLAQDLQQQFARAKEELAAIEEAWLRRAEAEER